MCVLFMILCVCVYVSVSRSYEGAEDVHPCWNSANANTINSLANSKPIIQ